MLRRSVNNEKSSVFKSMGFFWCVSVAEVKKEEIFSRKRKQTNNIPINFLLHFRFFFSSQKKELIFQANTKRMNLFGVSVKMDNIFIVGEKSYLSPN